MWATSTETWPSSECSTRRIREKWQPLNKNPLLSHGVRNVECRFGHHHFLRRSRGSSVYLGESFMKFPGSDPRQLLSKKEFRVDSEADYWMLNVLRMSQCWDCVSQIYSGLFLKESEIALVDGREYRIISNPPHMQKNQDDMASKRSFIPNYAGAVCAGDGQDIRRERFCPDSWLQASS